MNNEFKKIANGDTTRYILESASSGGTSTGSGATISKAMGGVQLRSNLLVQDTSQSLTPRSPVAHAAQKVAKGSGRHTDRKQQSKQVRGEKHKTKDFAENRDHEISMAGSELHSIFQNAKRLHAMIKHYSEEEGLDAWQQSKITKAADYLNSVLQSLQHEVMGEGDRTMSRAAKGMMKYGKDGMRALAKAGREGASEKQLDSIRDKHDHYNEGWSQKYKNSINCSHPKGFSQRAHCAGKRKHNESIEMEMTCPDCGMCKTHGNLNEIKKGQKDSNGFTKCWPGYHAQGTKKSATTGKQVRNCVPNEGVAEGLISSGDAALELLELNIFKDLIGEHSLSNYDEEFSQSPKWQKVVAKWAPKAEGLYNAIIRLHNLGKKISSQEARAITDTAYDGSDAYNDPESAASDLPRIYAQQYNAILQFIENLSNPKPNTIHEQGLAESQLDELDRPSGKLFIIVKADNAGATHVFGDFGSFPQDVMHKISKRGTRDKSGAKTKLKIDFLFDDFRSTIQQLRTIFRDVDFVGAEAAEFIIHSSALRSDQGEDVKHLRDYIEAGDDRRMTMYQKPEEDDDEDDGETTGGNMLRIDPETGAARKVVGVKPQTQMGGKSAEQPGMTTYRFKDPRFAQQLRGMNLGFNIKGDSITVDQKQKAKLVRVFGNKFGDVFANQERFKEDNSYMESLAQQLAEKIPKNAPVSDYIDDFAKAAKTPNAKGHHQFKNKSPEKVRQMAVAASYAAKNPSKKKK